jgi:hypothetical protein
MSQQNVEVIRAAFDAYNARDMDRRRIRAKRRALSRTSRIMAWRPPFGTFIDRPRSAIATLGVNQALPMVHLPGAHRGAPDVPVWRHGKLRR